MSTKEDRKQKEIDLCGKRLDIYVKEDGIMAVRIMYCNYYLDCPDCFGRQKDTRKGAIEKIFNHYHGKLFRAVISTEDWEAMAKQIRRKEIDYIRVPQKGNYLVISSAQPYSNDNRFVEISSFDAVMELTTEENLFSSGMRSSSRNWPLTKHSEQYSQTIEVEILIPAFVPSKEFGGPITLDVTNALYLHASTWKKGKVTLENVQEYSNHRTNKVIALALAAGITWDMELSKFRTVTYGLEQIEKWSVATVNDPNLTVTGPTNPYLSNQEYLLQINAIEPEDYIGIFREYLEGKLEEQSRFPDELQWAFGE